MNFNKLIKILIVVGLIAAIINLDQIKAYLKPFIARKKQITLEETDEDVEEEEEADCNLNVNELQNFLDQQIDMVQKKI